MGSDTSKLSKTIVTPEGNQRQFDPEKLEQVGDYFRIPKLNFIFDRISLSVIHSHHTVFGTVFVKKYGEHNVHALYPLINNEFKTVYEKPSYASGGFGKVNLYKTEGVASKMFVKRSYLTADFVVEFAIYKLLQDLTCIPELYDISLEQRTINFELGNDTLQKLNIFGKETSSIMFRLLKCMRAAEAQGIIHADIKPTNIVMSSAGKMLIIDWGIAMIEHSRTNPRRKNPLVQSLPFRAPELLITPPMQNYSFKIDIFSLGLNFYYIYTGDPLANGKTADEQIQLLLNNIIGKNYADCSKALARFVYSKPVYDLIKHHLMKTLPEDFADLLSHMLEFNPAHRWNYDKLLLHPFFQNIFRERIPTLPTFHNNMMLVKSMKGYSDRKILLKSIEIDVESFGYNLETLCLAFQLLDVCLVKKLDVQGTVLASACVSLAKKVYETEPERYVSPDVVLAETLVIQLLNGDIIIPTLISYFARLKNHSVQNPGRIPLYLREYMEDDIYSEPFLKRIENNSLKYLK